MQGLESRVPTKGTYERPIDTACNFDSRLDNCWMGSHSSDLYCLSCLQKAHDSGIYRWSTVRSVSWTTRNYGFTLEISSMAARAGLISPNAALKSSEPIDALGMPIKLPNESKAAPPLIPPDTMAEVLK